MLGKAGRLAYVVPTARPFITGLWGALAGARAARDKGKRECPPGRVPTRRFRTAARWLLTLLEPPSGEGFLPLEQVVCTTLPPIQPSAASVLFDASPWGGGAVLMVSERPVEYFEVVWTTEHTKPLRAKLGEASSQTTFEYLALYISLRIWASRFAEEGLQFSETTCQHWRAQSVSKARALLARCPAR